MIHSNKFFTILLAISALLTSCSDEELLEKKIKVTEGIPVTVSLPFGTHETTKIETRASDIEDKSVNTLAVIVFRKQLDGTIKKEGSTVFYDESNLPKDKIKLETKSGYNYIYAVANYTSSLFDLKDQLENVSTIEELQNLDIRLPENNISVLDDYFLMSGWFVADDATTQTEEGECVIDVNGALKTSGHIDLKHVMASITFNIKKGESVESFVADTWQVMSVPESSYLMEQENDNGGTKDADYFNSEVNSTFKLDMESGIYNFSFLMMENRKEIISNAPPTSFDEREKMEDKAGSPKTFVHADPRSTYVVLKGTYKGKTNYDIGENKDDLKDVLAYTTYYIHLGDWRNNVYSNFKIFRNNRYIYTVTILGVEKLLVEVTTDDEAWGSDGEMYLSSSHAQTFDAHYGTTVISFNKKEIEALAKESGSEDEFVKKFIILAATPLNLFVADEKDLDWVTYRRNPNDESRKSFAKYKDNTISGYDDKLLNAESFKRDLYRSVTVEDSNSYDSDGLIYYTCFIDEYFYYKDDEKMQPADYSMFINQSPRTIQISSNYIKNGTSSSESSINLATYVFSQKSIWTVYDLEKVYKDGINAWGTESIMEGGRVKSTETEIEDSKDPLQGRKNVFGFYKKRNLFKTSWDAVVDYKTNKMQEGEKIKTSFYACMNRNRDLNGNGIIDGDEIRWYLPALNQYMGFWMGVDVLPEEVRLYNGNKRLLDNENEYIYLSSTSREVKGVLSAMVFWASAGSSTSSYHQATVGYDPPTYKELSYRCVRNLKSVTGLVDDFLKAEGSLSEYGEPDTYQYFTNTYLNPRAMRANVTLPLDPNHVHLGEENRLPMKFEVSKKSEESIVWDKDKVKCPSGWRLPNQRELSLLVFHRRDNNFENGRLHSATKSGLYDKDPNQTEERRAYYLEYNVLLRLLSNKIDANYRCVRDVK